MKNKTLKNLIVVAAFAVFILGSNQAFAYNPSYGTNGYNSSYSDNYANYNNAMANQNNYAQQQASQLQYIYTTPQPYTYVQAQPKIIVQQAPQIQYLPQQTVQYVQQQPSVQYVNSGNMQGASVVRSNTTKVVTPFINTNSGGLNNSGQYVNYDPNSQSLGASAYGVYSDQQVAYDSNGVAALTVGGTGGFMPSSVFQWFILIMIILAIIIVARMISKSYAKNNHTVVTH